MNSANDTDGRAVFPSGERIRAYARKHFKSLRAFATHVQVDNTQLSIYVSGMQAPGYKVMKRFYDAGMSLDWLFADDREVHRYVMERSGEQERGRYVDQLTTEELLAEAQSRIREGR